MSEHDPSRPGAAYADTGGGKAILYTTTRAQEDAEQMGTPFDVAGASIGTATTTKAIGLIPPEGGSYHEIPAGTVRNVYSQVIITGGKYDGSDAYLVSIPDDNDHSGLLLASAASYVPKPATGGGDQSGRQAQWDADAASLLGPRP
jgi:hypothetical protein